MHKYCARTLSIDNYYTLLNCYFYSRQLWKQIQTFKSSNSIDVNNFFEVYLHTTLFCCLKIMVPIFHFQWSSKILTNLSNPITHLIISSLIIIKKKIQTTQVNNFISTTSYFPVHIHTSPIHLSSPKNTLPFLFHIN